MSFQADLQKARAVLVAQLDHQLDVVAHLPYEAWEAAFVERWGLAPDNNGRLAKLYLENAKLNPLGLDFHSAARAFHVNEFTAPNDENTWRRWRKMEEDFDRVAPELVEDRLTAAQQDKLLQGNERLNPTEAQRVGRQVFDLGALRKPSGWTPPRTPTNPLENTEA